MYTRTALAWLATAATTLALSGIALAADPGKSPNGPPGPEGNPNQPQSAPQAPPAKQESAPNGEANGHSKAAPNSQSKKPSSKPKPKRKSKSKSNHANPSPGTPRKGGREDRPSPKVTICHATGSETNPYVQITISENGLNGHGHHHKKAGRPDDIIPAPAGGCPSTAPTQQSGGEQGNTTTTTTTPTTPTTETVAVAPERTTGESGVLGAQASGGSDEPGGGGVLGAQASGGSDAAPAAARESRRATVGSLPFTGFELAFVVIVGLVALLGGVALRRSLAPGA